MDGVCRRIKAVDISPILSVLDRLHFVAVNGGSTNPAKSPCSVTLPGHPLPEKVSRFVKGLELGGETRRVLFRKLYPHQGMAPHVDAFLSGERAWQRFQVPITSHPDIKMRWPLDGVEVHLEPGFLYEVRFDRLHEVIHGADCERLHLQIDQVGATV